MGGEFNIKKVAVGGLSFIALSVLCFRYYTGILPTGLFISVGVVLSAAVIFLILKFLTTRKELSVYFFALAVAGVLAVATDAVVNRIKLSNTQNNADLLVTKLREYKDKFGTYPESLDQLVTNSLLPEVPDTSFPNNMFYYERIAAPDSGLYEYTLKFYVPLGMEAVYSSSKKRWEYDD